VRREQREDRLLPPEDERDREQQRLHLLAEQLERARLVELLPALQRLQRKGTLVALGRLAQLARPPLGHVVGRQAVVHVNVGAGQPLRKVLEAEALAVRVAAALLDVGRIEVLAGRHAAWTGRRLAAPPTVSCDVAGACF
jgi:hypothetical protein